MTLKISKMHKCQNMQKYRSTCVERVHTHHRPLSKSTILGRFFSCSFFSWSFRHSSSARCLSSSSSANLANSSCLADSTCTCWSQASTSCLCVRFQAALSCSMAWLLSTCALFIMICLIVAYAAPAKSGHATLVGSCSIRSIAKKEYEGTSECAYVVVLRCCKE